MAKKIYKYKFADRFDSYERLHTFIEVDDLFDKLEEDKSQTTFSVLLSCGTDNRSKYKVFSYIKETSAHCFYIESNDHEREKRFLKLIENSSKFLLIWDEETSIYVNKLNPSIKIIPISLMLKKAFIRLNSNIIPNEQNFINFLIEISNIPIEKNTTIFWNTYVPYTSMGMIRIANNSHEIDDSLMNSCVNGKNLFKNRGELPEYFFMEDKPFYKKMDLNHYPEYLINSNWKKRVSHEEDDCGLNILSSLCQLKLGLNIGSMMKHKNIILLDFYDDQESEEMMWFLILNLSLTYISLNKEKKRVIKSINKRLLHEDNEVHKNIDDFFVNVLNKEEHIKGIRNRFYREVYINGDKLYDQNTFERTCSKMNYDVEYIKILTDGDFLMDIQKNSHMNMKNVVSIFYHGSQKIIGLLY